MNQDGVTLICALSAAGRWQELAQRLRTEGDRLQGDPAVSAAHPLARLWELHFLSLFVIPPDARNPQAFLCLEANFDGPRRAFLTHLVQANRPLLDAFFGYCEDYPGPGGSNEEVYSYLDDADQGYDLFYVGCPGRSVEQITDEAGLAHRITLGVRALQEPAGRRFEIVRQIWNDLTLQDRDLVLGVPERPFWVRNSLLRRPLGFFTWLLNWPLYVAGLAVIALLLIQAIGWPLWPAVAPPPYVVTIARDWAKVLLWVFGIATLGWAALLAWEFPAELTPRTKLSVIAAQVGEYAWVSFWAVPGFAALLGVIALLHWHEDALVWLGAGLLRALAVLILVVGLVYVVYFLVVARRELDDRVTGMTWDAQRLTRLRNREEHGAQNHIVSVTTIRPGWLRWATLWVVLRVIHWAARILHNPLGLFNTQSIHFVRWTILPGRRLLFISNYDGSFGGYLGIFATLGAAGVTAIWANTEDFPRSFMLLWDGARDEQRFKARARDSQVETLLWYRRYPDLSVSAIDRNSAIREELAHFSRDGREIPEADFDAFLRRFSATRP